ncbi:sigma-70 family RNA polymerase sigma factor [Nocardioides currus]|uniref:RNA polymerase subunit sigma n=1 Tax=Nocardioides currus TaxID=2133958 RepID=A0A2R7YWE4_9ACTN|nr:sigma-70 family RNA polymerase sigma factor [Nocardioides currus]PUA80376.1 RNA polymerase subunit sigma [Nocardioides currus]
MTGRTARTTHAPPSTVDPLAELLLRSGRGDEDAFAEVYAATSHRIYGIALRVARDPHQAEEAAQDAFAEIWLRSARFDPARGSAIGWMMTLAHRRTVDHVRSSAAGRRRDDSWHQDTAQLTAPDTTFDQARANLDARVVHTAMTCLSAVQRRAVELAYFDGHTYAEVSRIMQTPVGTTKTRMRTALLLLRAHAGVATTASA